MKTGYWFLLLPMAVACGQPPTDFGASVRAAMEPSLSKQRDSAKKQAASISKKVVDPADSSFFTVPFATESTPVAEHEALSADELDMFVDAEPHQGAPAEEKQEKPSPTVPMDALIRDVFDLKEEAGTGSWLLKVLGAFNATSNRADQEGEILRKLRAPDYKPPKIVEVDR